MRHALLSAVVILPLVSLSGISLAAADFPHQGSDLAVDPAVTWGVLPNGLRYALLPNQQPKDKVTIRLQIPAGSIQETDAQRGLAHYLEHMAFNGSTHYPPGELVKQLQHLGLQFGTHTNAHTSFDETVYKLDLPDAKPETIAIGLTVMADWAGGMTLDPAEIARERGVILAELRDRASPGQRIWEASAKLAYAGTKVGERLPIGIAETINAADQTLLKSYYDGWYRPGTMVLAVVGTIDPAAVAKQVTEILGPVADRAPALAQPDLTTLSVSATTAFLLHHEAESEDTEVQWERVMVEPEPKDTVERQRDELRRELAERILGRRLRAIIEKDADAPISGGGAFSYHWLGFAHAGIQANARSGKAVQALALITTEYRRLLQYGPTEAELTVERKAIASELDTAVTQAGTRQSANLAQGIYSAVSHGQVFQSPVQRRALVVPMLPTITPAEIVANLAVYRGRAGRELVSITGREDLGANGEPAVRSAFATALGGAVTAPEDRALATWAYGEPPEANGLSWTTESDAEKAQGVQVLERRKDGIRLQYRTSDAQPGQVLVGLRYELPVGPRPAGVEELIERGLVPGGLGKHAADEIATLYADSSVRLMGVTLGDDGFQIGAVCKSDDLNRAFQLLRAYVTDPGWRSEAEPRVKQAWLETLAAQELEVDARVSRTLATVLSAGDAWRRPATADEAAAVTFAQAKAWLATALAQAPLTVTIAGDGPSDAVDSAVLWFGQHRAGRAFKPLSEAQTREALAVNKPVAPVVERLAVAGSVPKAVIQVVWPTDDIYDIHQARRLNLVAQALGEKLRESIREKLGAAYSPAAWHMPGESYRGQGQLNALVSVAPDQADTVLALVRAEAVALAKEGVDAELLGRIQVPAVKSLAATKRKNDWWAGTVLPRLASQPFRVAWAAGIEADYQSITPAEVSALAAKYLVDAKAIAVVGVSAGKSEPKLTPKPSPKPSDVP